MLIRIFDEGRPLEQYLVPPLTDPSGRGTAYGYNDPITVDTTAKYVQTEAPFELPTQLRKVVEADTQVKSDQ